MKKKLILIPLLVLMLVASLVTVTGCAGEQGSKGDQGSMGIRGIQGEQGESGLVGLQGEQGPIGLQGEAGLEGVRGRTGLRGATGPAGAKGDEGEEGERGQTGAGARGATGATGLQGPPGPQGDPGIISGIVVSYATIQDAINAASSGATIYVPAGEYAGAIVNKDVTIIGAPDGTSVITSGVPYKASGSPYSTGFRLDPDADRAEIRNFTMNGDYGNNEDGNKFWFGVFARNADSVIVDSLALNDMVQGITSWGGSNWEITNNVIDDTYPTSGGGIAIYLGADPTEFPHCDNNLVQDNIISTSAVQKGTFTGAAICLWFDERGWSAENPFVAPTDQSVTGNQIKDNSMTAIGQENQVGIEIGVGGLKGDDNPEKVAACLGVIHDNTVTNNTIDNAEWGLYLYVTTNLTVQGNTITNCSDCGIYMKDDHANCLINNNNIYENTTYGLNNTDGAAYSTTVDATYNWWGNASGPTHTSNPEGTGDSVSDSVNFADWLLELEVW